jgi:LCP family protein required for cell wall assembly
LISLAVGGLYTATSVVVHVDNVVLPGVDVSLPRPVAKVLPGLDPEPSEGSPGTKRINILLLGVDRRPHHDPAKDGPPNTDSIHILSLDPITKTASALSLPRDLYVEVPSPEKSGEFWEIRINTAFKLGEEYGYQGGGPAFAKRAIEYNFHLPIDYYAVVDWVAFADVIDALGGIWVTVPEEMRNVEGFNPRDGNSFTITIPAGTHYLDSITALAYARFRDDDQNDFGRIDRQQAVMRATADEALRAGWLTRAPKLYDRFRDAVQTDLSALKVPGLVLLAKSIGMESVKTVSLAGAEHQAVTPVITPWGEDVLIPIWDEMGAIIRSAIDDPALQSEGATVSIINATGVRGQGDRAVAYLRRFLLPPGRITTGQQSDASSSSVAGGAPSQSRQAVSDKTTIAYTGNALQTATRLAEWLGVPQDRVSGPGTLGDAASVTVTLGADVRIPADDRFRNYRAR